jgi:hypothetical protein
LGYVIFVNSSSSTLCEGIPSKGVFIISYCVIYPPLFGLDNQLTPAGGEILRLRLLRFGFVYTEELEQLCILVKELKRHDCVVALKVIKFMLQRKVFLYGCVAINQRSIADSCDKLAAQAASRLHHARNR